MLLLVRLAQKFRTGSPSQKALLQPVVSAQAGNLFVALLLGLAESFPISSVPGLLSLCICICGGAREWYDVCVYGQQCHFSTEFQSMAAYSPPRSLYPSSNEGVMLIVLSNE